MVDPVLPAARPDRQSRGDRLDHHRNRDAAAVTVLSEIDVAAVSDHEPVGTLAHTRSRRQFAAGNPLHVRHARLRNQQPCGAAAARLFHRRPAVPSTGPRHEQQQSRGHHRHGQPGTDARMRFAMERDHAFIRYLYTICFFSVFHDILFQPTDKTPLSRPPAL